MKKIINILLSFFMAVIIFGLGSSLTAFMATSAPYINVMVGLSGYTKKAATEIADYSQSVAIPSGLPENFFDDKIHTDFLKKTVKESVKAALSGKDYQMPTEEIEELIYKDILEYAKLNGIETDEEDAKMLKNTANLAATYYKNYSYNIFYRILKTIKGVSLKMLVATAVLLALLIAIYYLLKGTKELSFGLLAGGIMLITPIIFAITGAAFKWAIASTALLGFINLYIGIMIALMVLMGAAAIFIGIKKAKEHL